MKRIVVDASVAFSWILATQVTRSAEALRTLADAEFIAPFIFGFELRNGFLRAERQKRIAPATADLAIADLLGAVVRLDDPPDAASMEAALTLARALGLSYYDACYLEFAQRAIADLASRDEPLLQAAARLGIKVYDAR